MIYLNGYPFLDSKEEHAFGVPVSHVMSSRVVCLAASGMAVRDVEKLMNENAYQGYPVVATQNRMLVGYIGRTELRYALERAKKDATPDTPCSFDTSSPSPSIDLSRFIDPTPLTVHPRLPLETVMELFKKMGPRVILIEYRGRLTGLVTVKDCLRFQVKVEAQGGAGLGEEGMEWVAEWLWGVVEWVDGVLERVGMGSGRGGVRLGAMGGGNAVGGRRDDVDGGGDVAFSVGDDEDENGDVELEDRGRGRR